MSSTMSVLVASDDARVRDLACEAAKKESLDCVLCGDGLEAFESAKNHKSEQSPLKLLVLEAFLPKTDGFEVVRKLQEFPHTRALPVLMLIGSSHSKQFQSGARPAGKNPAKIRLLADNYLEKPFEEREIQSRIHSMIKHYRPHNAPHPVSALPGHPQIEQEVFARFARGETFDLVWVDINHFRPFNDHYGTAKGDEAIRATVTLFHEVLRTAGTETAPYLAQVDGDDLIILFESGKSESFRKTLRDRFQEMIVQFYSPEERAKGFFQQMGRDQKESVFPLMSLSMVVLSVSMEKYLHYGQIVSEANELLHQTKIGAQDLFK